MKVESIAECSPWVLKTIFCHQVIAQRAVRTSLEKQLDPRSNRYSRRVGTNTFKLVIFQGDPDPLTHPLDPSMEFDQNMSQSQITNRPMVPRGRGIDRQIKILYYIPINGTSFKLSVFWLSESGSRINELRFFDSVLLSFKTRLKWEPEIKT